MSEYNFIIGEKYTKNDIYRICSVPVERQKGNWNTGYTNYEGDWFIFCNVGIPGRTGHDYQNRFIADDLYWYGKSTSKIGQDSIDSMINPKGIIFIFYREDDREPFIFAGKAKAKKAIDTTPVEILWEFSQSAENRPEVLAEEVSEPEKYKEGTTKSISVNVYERNPQARKKCLDFYDYKCSVCDFDFFDIYGDIGKNYIHVHHLKQLAEIGEEYELDPIEDLRPVCPNCHSMIHRKRPAYTIEEIKEIIKPANKALH